ncbi:hypothetical protein GMST_25520 [Geomonas silvestris]|uniref:Uncharacterized protein n=1 Tax=Geomonas silvestris TaxID=2740184 RepID=A0A6V8MJX5_9BACT|nr:tetratricopeptide repeat protein [Geomonas silvestris]GFO60227.1 hypothetical protein GMST_25520 [Geomonas silvestris]
MGQLFLKIMPVPFIMLIVLLEVVARDAVAEDICNVLLQKSQTAANRTVYLSDGNALELFQKYLDEAGKRSIKVDPWKIRVILVANKERKEFSLNWIQMLTGQGAKERWTGLLKNLKAEPNDAVLKEATRQQWDMICYSGSGGEVAKQPRPPVNEPVPAGSNKSSLEAKQHFQQGMQYAARHDFKNAVKEFTNAIQANPSYAGAYSNRGVAYMQQKKFDLAEDDLKKAVELGPKDGKNYYNLACWFSLRNQVGRGIVAIDSALTNGFNDYNALRKDGDLANLRKSPDWQTMLDKHKVFLGKAN